MTNYLCIEHDKGARIGHQTNNYFSFLLICNFYNLTPVYHPFSGYSSHFEHVLSFNDMHILSCEEKSSINVNSADDILNQKNEGVLYRLDLGKNSSIFNQLLKPVPKKDSIFKLYQQHKKRLGSKYYEKNPYKENNNLIVHIRRGDAVGMESRILGVDYFHRLVKKIFENDGEYNLYITSEPNLEDVSIFNEFNPTILTHKTDIEAFYHMANADVVVGSPSGFSHLAYILGKGDYYRSPKDWFYYDKDVKIAYK
jgi:hypothetical protein